MKSAARYVALDGADKLAIVVCSDIAEYARGSSGEATQGAGAVALLIEEQPTLLEFDLARGGSASDYRGPDFRKPFVRYVGQTPSQHGQIRDFPVFNGKYSTSCYLDETLLAMADLFAKCSTSIERWNATAAAFLHRPYRRMAETGLAATYLLALARGGATERDALTRLAGEADVEPAALIAELTGCPQLYDRVVAGESNDDAYRITHAALRALRRLPLFETEILNRMRFGEASIEHCGNLYTASMPGWLAAGLEDAAQSGALDDGADILAFGYGSGDAAEVVPMRLVPSWRGAAARIGFAAALDGAIDLDQGGYEQLHDTLDVAQPAEPRAATFVIDRVGERRTTSSLDDHGIEYYRFVR
jgi:hydroxymethylglutaryl-CoA synthase